MDDFPFSLERMTRHSRQLLLKPIGGKGQARLKDAVVFLLGAGGLGSPAAYYLAAAGVGHLVIADGDQVELSNLQRQILHTTERIGQFKAESALQALQALDPEIKITSINKKITQNNIRTHLAGCDLVVDGSDNFAARYLLNAYCKDAGKVLVSGAVLGFGGQVATFRHGVDPAAPCYRCLYPQEEEGEGSRDALPTCATAGVLGAVAGVVGAWQAAEAVREILGIGTGLASSLLLLDLLDGLCHRVAILKDPVCPVCGTGSPTALP